MSYRSWVNRAEPTLLEVAYLGDVGLLPAVYGVLFERFGGPSLV